MESNWKTLARPRFFFSSSSSPLPTARKPALNLTEEKDQGKNIVALWLHLLQIIVTVFTDDTYFSMQKEKKKIISFKTIEPQYSSYYL